MKLWIVDADDVGEADIARACSAAEALITRRGMTVDAAYQAVMRRFDRKPFDRHAAKAWDDAEEAALSSIYGEDVDDWPDGPVLAPYSERKTS